MKKAKAEAPEVIEVTLTVEKKDKYVKSGGAKCPHCDSDALSGDGGVEITKGEANQAISCGNCEARWFDTYTLTGMEKM